MAQGNGDEVLGMAACGRRRGGGAVAGGRLGVGAVADRRLLATEAARVLVGQDLDGAAGDEAVREAASLAAAAAQPFEDLHASVAYRRQLVSLLSEQVIRQGWLDADDRAGEGGP